MTPRVAPSYQLERDEELEQELFWRFMFAPADFEARKLFTREEFRVLSKGASGGGFLVPESVEDQVVVAARAESAIAQASFELRTDRGELLGLPLAATLGTANWTAESAGYTASDEVYTQASMGAHKSTAMVVVSEELATDSEVPVDALMAMHVGGRLGTLQAAAFATGSGSGQPAGAVAAASPYTVSTAPTGNATAFSRAAILQFYKALGAAYRPNATWIMHPDDYAELAALASTDGELVFPGLQENPPTLFGRPVLVDAAMPTPAASAKSLLFGDMARAYAIRRVRGVGLQRLDEIRSDNGQITFRSNERLDGKPTLAAAAIIGQHSAT